MRAHRRRQRQATRPAKLKPRDTATKDATGNGRARTRGSKRAAAADSKNKDTAPDAVERAALEYAKELPSMLRRAMKRAARGKPSPLLRSAPRLIREAMQLLEMHDERRQRKPRKIERLEELGVLSDFELCCCRDTVLLMRGQREDKPQSALERETAIAPPLPEPLTRERPDGPQQVPTPTNADSPTPPPPLYSGPDRRWKHIPSNVHLGHHEHRKQQIGHSPSIVGGKRVLYIDLTKPTRPK